MGRDIGGVYYGTLVDNRKYPPIRFLEKDYKITVQKSWKMIYVFWFRNQNTRKLQGDEKL